MLVVHSFNVVMYDWKLVKKENFAETGASSEKEEDTRSYQETVIWVNSSISTSWRKSKEKCDGVNK